MARMKTNGISKLFSKLSREETFSSSEAGDDCQAMPTADLPLSCLLFQEARAVSLWSCLVILFRLFVISVVHLATRPLENSNNNREYLVLASVLASALLVGMPYKVATLQAPGFVLAHPWLLLWVEKKTGVLPNVPTRCAEYMLGRLTFRRLVLSMLVHFGCVLFTASFWNQCLPDPLASLGLAPIEYPSSIIPISLWIVVFGREVLVNALFSIALLVVPVLLKLNHVPPYWCVVVMYPLFNFAVDTASGSGSMGMGMGSSLAPNMLLAMSALRNENDIFSPVVTVSPNLILGLVGSIVGGLVGGKVMQRYFPDDQK